VAQARELLAQALGGFSEGMDTADLQAAAALCRAWSPCSTGSQALARLDKE
jgi:hypothetical protein